MRLFTIAVFVLALGSCGDSAQDESKTEVEPKTPCRQAGNYQAGKEGSYQPCCAGLVEVAQRSKAEVNGVLACTDLPLRVYACIEGSCGDGRCEAPENVPCGCALDCPAETPAP